MDAHSPDNTRPDSTRPDSTSAELVDEPADRRLTLRNIDIRRALLAVLLDADRPLTVDEIVGRLGNDHGVVLEGRQAVSARQRVADMARYQARCGRLRRVGRGRYVGVPEVMSRSMVWRCRNWRLLRDRSMGPRTAVPGAAPHARAADCCGSNGAA